MEEGGCVQTEVVHLRSCQARWRSGVWSVEAATGSRGDNNLPHNISNGLTDPTLKPLRCNKAREAL